MRFTFVAFSTVFLGTASPFSRAVALVCQFCAAFFAVSRLFQLPPLKVGFAIMPLSGMEKLRSMPSSAILCYVVAYGRE